MSGAAAEGGGRGAGGGVGAPELLGWPLSSPAHRNRMPCCWATRRGEKAAAGRGPGGVCRLARGGRSAGLQIDQVRDQQRGGEIRSQGSAGLSWPAVAAARHELLKPSGRLHALHSVFSSMCTAVPSLEEVVARHLASKSRAQEQDANLRCAGGDGETDGSAVGHSDRPVGRPPRRKCKGQRRRLPPRCRPSRRAPQIPCPLQAPEGRPPQSQGR